MTMIESTYITSPSPLTGFGRILTRSLAWPGRALRVEITRRQTLAELDRLSPRLLADIGLEGEDLRRCAYDMAHRAII